MSKLQPIRALLRQPGFTAVVVLTLALGIGANTAVFSIFDQVILQLLPVKNPRELVLLDVSGQQMEGFSQSDNRHTVHSYPTYVDLKERSKVFSGVVSRASAPLSLAYGGDSERADGELVSGNFFEVLGVRPAVGRLIEETDDQLEGGHPVAVLDYGFWQRRFAGRDEIVGRTITLNGYPMEVIGIAPYLFRGVLTSRSPNVYVPLSMRRQMRPNLFVGWDRDPPERRLRYLNVIARLKSGVTREQAEGASQGAYSGIVEEILAGFDRPVSADERHQYLSKKVQLTPAYQGIHDLRDSIGQPLLWLSGMVAVVLLITCVNVAGLMVARSLAGTREVAVRLALGSGRGALIRQLLAESLTLAVLGGFAGLLVTRWAMEALVYLAGGSDGVLTARINARVLGFNFALASVVGVLFGIAPVWQALRVSVVESLKSQTAGVGEALRGVRFRNGAVVAQVALSVLLLVTAGLFARSLYNLKNVDPGFRTESILTFALDPQLSGYDRARGHAFYDELLRRFRLLPGVRSAGAADMAVLESGERGGSITVEDYHGDHEGSSRNAVSAGFFEALDIPIVAGRPFTERDQDGAPKVAVVNETFLRRFVQDGEPLGKRLAFSRGNPTLDVEIVGVARDIRPGKLKGEAKPLVYTPFVQESRVPALTFYLRTTAGEEALGPAVRRTVSELDKTVPVYEMRTIEAARNRAASTERTVATLSAAFGALATLLAAVGLYGLLAFSVTRRTREIGLRVALGATRKNVVRLVMKQALVCVGLGLAVGLPATLALVRYLESQLFGLTPYDPWVIAGAIATLGCAALAAAFLPARRAARADPAEVLRYE